MRFSFLASLVSLAAVAASVMAGDSPFPGRPHSKPATPKYVFAHFIVGIAAPYTQADWTADLQLAQAAGINWLALNIGALSSPLGAAGSHPAQARETMIHQPIFGVCLT